MMPSPARALLDANVLYSNHLRNLLLQMAQNDLFEVNWSPLIEQEWLRNMEPGIRKRIEAHTLPLIRSGFPNALITDFDADLAIGSTHEGDRHVASAAVAVAPCTLVTNNLRHFDTTALQTFSVGVRSPDDFLTELFVSKPTVVDAAMRDAAANLTRTRPSWDEYLDILAHRCTLQTFVTRLRSLQANVTPAAPTT